VRNKRMRWWLRGSAAVPCQLSPPTPGLTNHNPHTAQPTPWSSQPQPQPRPQTRARTYTLSTSGRSSLSTLIATKCWLSRSAASSSSNDSRSITWHLWGGGGQGGRGGGGQIAGCAECACKSSFAWLGWAFRCAMHNKAMAHAVQLPPPPQQQRCIRNDTQPVAGAVAHGTEDGLVLRARQLKRLLAPGEPVHLEAWDVIALRRGGKSGVKPARHVKRAECDAQPRSTISREASGAGNLLDYAHAATDRDCGCMRGGCQGRAWGAWGAWGQGWGCKRGRRRRYPSQHHIQSSTHDHLCSCASRLV